MNIIDLIEKKKQKQSLNQEEIEYFVNGYLNGEIEKLREMIQRGDFGKILTALLCLWRYILLEWILMKRRILRKRWWIQVKFWI